MRMTNSILRAFLLSIASDSLVIAYHETTHPALRFSGRLESSIIGGPESRIKLDRVAVGFAFGQFAGSSIAERGISLEWLMKSKKRFRRTSAGNLIGGG